MNPLQTLIQLEIEKAKNDAALQNGLPWVEYIREDLRIAHEIRIALLRLQAQRQAEIIAAKEAQRRERHLVKLGGLL